MPMGWVEPEVFLEHNGVKVYHAYKDNEASRKLVYHYTTSACDEEDWTFDVRDLSDTDDAIDPNDPKDHDAMIRYGLESGQIKYPEDEWEEMDDNVAPPTPEEFVLQVEGGNRIVSPAYPLECSYVRIIDPDDVELVYWDSEEWADDPVSVMGALLAAAKTGKVHVRI